MATKDAGREQPQASKEKYQAFHIMSLRENNKAGTVRKASWKHKVQGL